MLSRILINPCSFRGRPAGRPLGRRGSMSLMEMMMAVGISSMLLVAVALTFQMSPWILARTSTELKWREETSSVLRGMQSAIRGSNLVEVPPGSSHKITDTIYASYSNRSSEAADGTCLYIQNSNFFWPKLPAPGATGDIAFYYYSPDGENGRNGSIFYDPDTRTPPNPAADTRLITANRVSALTFKRDPKTGAIWIYIRGDVRVTSDYESTKFDTTDESKKTVGNFIHLAAQRANAEIGP